MRRAGGRGGGVASEFWGVGCAEQCLGFQVFGLGFEVWNEMFLHRFRVSKLLISDFRFWVSIFGFRADPEI